MSAPFRVGQLVSLHPTTDLWGAETSAATFRVTRVWENTNAPGSWWVRADEIGRPAETTAPADMFYAGGGLFNVETPSTPLRGPESPLGGKERSTH